jgi:hypothetical protein
MSDAFLMGGNSSATAGDFAPIVRILANADASAARFGLTDPKLRAAYHAQVMMILSASYVEVFGTDVASPDWVPYIPYYHPRAAPNPDTVYAFAPVEASGVYRISGVKGTETIAAITLRKGGAHIGQRSAARVGEIDFEQVAADANGEYSFVLSATRPDAHSGQWFELHPEATCLMLRHVTKDASQRDGVCGIERIDRPRARLALTDAEIAARFEMMERYTSSQNEFLLGYLKRLRDLKAHDGFVLDDQSGYGGLIVQSHYFHMFTIAEDEALILESNLPGKCKYWSIQVINPLATTIDYTLHQSSLNDQQARTDSDRRVRCVLSVSDPGVPNWLDCGGWLNGGVQWRWNEVDTAPHPTVKRVKLENLRQELPADTPYVSGAERAASLSARAAYYQRRRR